MKLLSINKKALKNLLAAPAFSPTDCPNFLTYKDFNQYRWYARTLAPLLLLTGGGPLFVGNRVETFRGESPCETWMLVRYKDHRGMLKMIMNPYYVLIPNYFRARGTARLELAFTQPRDPKSGIEKERWVLGVHVRTPDADAFFENVRALAKKAGLTVVYESEQRLTFDFIPKPKANDPNPLTFPVTAAIGGGSEAALREFAAAAGLETMLGKEPGACVQLYRRGSMREYIRFSAPS